MNSKYPNLWASAAVILMMFILFFAGTGCRNMNGIRPEQVQGIASDTKNLEGIEWYLAELSGSPLLPLPGERQPVIKFDGAKKQASGFNGCNNFFGSYEISESSLKFGPVAATRRFCEGISGEVEMKFTQALDKTRSWEIKDGVLMFFDNTNVLARFTAVQKDMVEIDLDSMTFLSQWFPSGKVTLSHGEYREPTAPGSASEIIVKLNDKRAFGLINGRETGAVILVTESGGSGTFYNLALLSKEAEGWVNTDTFLLGDRVNVQEIEIKDDRINVIMRTHSPDDPLCCPTRETVNKFTIKENKLVPIIDKPSAKNILDIIGIVWKWEKTLYNNDTKTIPAHPDQYTLKLHHGGKVEIHADCKRYGGTYVKEGSSISIHITHTTKAMCPPGSLEGEYLRNLAAAAVYFQKDGNLYFDLKFDTGTMKFNKQ